MRGHIGSKLVADERWPDGREHRGEPRTAGACPERCSCSTCWCEFLTWANGALDKREVQA